MSSDRVDVRYILDEAEIPTFQQRGVADAELLRAQAGRGRAAAGADRRRPPRRAASRRARATIAHPEGQGGLRDHARRAAAGRARRRRRGGSSCATGRSPAASAGRRSWSSPASGTAVRSSVPATTRRTACAAIRRTCSRARPTCAARASRVQPGRRARVQAPGRARRASAGRATATTASPTCSATPPPGRASCSCCCSRRSAGARCTRSRPGHGKAMVAAYLVGTRGTPRHAVALGATVTVTHTVGVFALGAVALALSQYILPETLYPWLNLVSGALVLVVGAGVLRSRIRWARARRDAPTTHHHHDHDHHARPRRTTTSSCTRTAAASRTATRRRSVLVARPARDGRVGRADPVPVRARRAARRRSRRARSRSGCS